LVIENKGSGMPLIQDLKRDNIHAHHNQRVELPPMQRLDEALGQIFHEVGKIRFSRRRRGSLITVWQEVRVLPASQPGFPSL
jgi:hypothetical protein